MKKKLLSLIFAICLIIPCVIMLSACGKDDQEYYTVHIYNTNVLFGENYEVKVEKGSTYGDIKVKSLEGYTLDDFSFVRDRVGANWTTLDDKVEPDYGDQVYLYANYKAKDNSARLTIDGLTAEYNLERGLTVYNALSKAGVELNDYNTCGWFTDKELINPVDSDIIVPATSYVTLATNRCGDFKELSFFKNNSNTTMCGVNINPKYANNTVVPKRYLFEDESIGRIITSINFNNDNYIEDYRSEDITIPGSVLTISGADYYGWKSLMSINLPEGLQSFSANLGQSAITEIKIPSTLTLFTGKLNGVKLESIIVDEDNTVYTSKQNLNAILENETGNLILGCKNTTLFDDDYVNTPTIGVKHICSGAFAGVDFGSNVLEFTVGLESIGEGAFKGCRGLSKVVLWSGVQIGKSAFANSDLTRIYIPNTVTRIYKTAFAGVDYNKAIIYCEVDAEPEDYGCWSGLTTGNEIDWNYSDSTHQIATKYGCSYADFLSENS